MSQLDRDTMNRLLSADPMSRCELKALFGKLVAGELDEIQAAGIVAALKARGERSEELVGAAEALLESAIAFPGAPVSAIDIVGTGGDGLNTLNISTLAAVTAAAMGVPVAKHGNRSITSLSGSFDLLERLGVEVHASPEQAARQLTEAGLCFLFAPDYHRGLRHAGEMRRRLNARTIFNLLGPLVNPARPRAMLLGVARSELLLPLAEALRELGCTSAAVVHGGGLDEVAVHSDTEVVWLGDGELQRSVLQPEDFGVAACRLQELTADTAEASHLRAERVLAGGGTSAENSAVAVNAALAARVFHGTGELREWTNQALQVLRSGAGRQQLQRLQEIGPA